MSRRETIHDSNPALATRRQTSVGGPMRLAMRTAPIPKRLKVLVTDGSYKHSLGIIRTLGRAGHWVATVSHTIFAPGFRSRFVSQSEVIADPIVDSGRFAEQLRRLAEIWGIDLLIPVGFASVMTVSGSMALRRRAIVPTAQQFHLASDKWAMLSIAQSAGLRVPSTVLLRDAGDAAGLLETLTAGSPIVIKPRRETYGAGASYATTANDCGRILKERFIDPVPPDEVALLAQEYVPGSTQGYFALARQGQVVREFMHRRRRELPPQGGAATAAESIWDDGLASDGRALIAALEWDGPAMIEFRVNSTGRYLIEFNPKFWGSLDLALACDADFPGDLCRIANGEDLTERPRPRYRIGQRYWWPWRGDIRRLLQRPADVPAVIADCLNPRVKSNWSWADPVPTLLEIGGELTHAWRKRRSSGSRKDKT